MRSRDDLCLIVNGVHKRHNHSLSVQWLLLHISSFQQFFFFPDCSQTMYLLLCIQSNLHFVVQLEKTKSLLRWHVVKVNVWACFPLGLWMGGTVHLVRVRNFVVVLLQSQSQPTPFHLLFLLLTDVGQSASLLFLMAVSPLGHIQTNWRKPPPLKGEPQKLFLSDTFVAARTFSDHELFVRRLALQWWEEGHTQSQLIGTAQMKRAGLRHGSHALSWQ